MSLLDRAGPPDDRSRRFALQATVHGPPIRWRAAQGRVTGEPPGLGSVAQYRAIPRPGLDTIEAYVPSDARPLVARITVLTVHPFAALSTEHLLGYRIGRYPEAPPASAPQSRAPRLTPLGFVELTAETRPVSLSTHVRLGDLACKQRHDGPTAVVALDVRLLDKLERLADLLADRGIAPDAMTIMSGYRTPYYNALIGNRTRWSRHVMGDGADVFVDADRDGTMDDLDGDGRVTIDDARALLALVDTLDEHPALAGGAAAYPATASHGPFVHLDTRGYHARW